MSTHVILASGPYGPDLIMVLWLLIIIACIGLPVALFGYAFVHFHRGKLTPGLMCFLLSALFLIPLWWAKEDFYGLLIAFVSVFIVALPLWILFVVRKR